MEFCVIFFYKRLKKEYCKLQKVNSLIKRKFTVEAVYNNVNDQKTAVFFIYINFAFIRFSFKKL